MRAALVLLALSVACPAFADDAPGTALITTAAARQGSLPDIVTVYGAAAPAQNGGVSISLQQDGRVGAIAVTQGERVAAGANLLTFEVSAAGTSAYAQAVTALSLAQTQRAHTAQLLGERLATRDQLAQADKAVSDARASLDALVRQGANRGRMDVRAPFDGIVETIAAAQGQRVVAGTPLLTLTRLDGLVVTVGVDPALHPRLHPGLQANLKPVGAEAPFAGQVLRVDSVVNAKTRLLDVDIGVPVGQVISGEFFSADLTLGMVGGWIVPHDSVLQDERGYFLFQDAAGKAVRVDVGVLATQGAEDAVDGKLDGKLAVIVDGATQLSDGDPVRIGASTDPAAKGNAGRKPELEGSD